MTDHSHEIEYNRACRVIEKHWPNREQPHPRAMIKHYLIILREIRPR